MQFRQNIMSEKYKEHGAARLFVWCTDQVVGRYCHVEKVKLIWYDEKLVGTQLARY